MSEIRGEFLAQVGNFKINVSLDIAEAGACAIFGRSGSGKSTILRWMAGLIRSDRGILSVGGEVWEDSERRIFLPPERRSVGYVFQEGNLFPHLSVAQNIKYAYQRNPDMAFNSAGVDRTFQMLGISSLLEKKPFQLSGGERQRVALARSLIMKPKLLLLDEPLSALDDVAKEEILLYLEKIKYETCVPMIYVSHSVNEVRRFCDSVVQIHDGRVIKPHPAENFISQVYNKKAPSFEEAQKIVRELIQPR